VPAAVPSDHTSGNLRWKGCVYQKESVYTVSFAATNMTTDRLAQRHRFQFRSFQILGRDAGTDGPDTPDDLAGADCTLLVAIKGGGMYVGVTNSVQLTTNTDPCRFATDLATKLVPLLPAGS